MTIFTIFFAWLQILNLPALLLNKNTWVGPFPWKWSILQNPDRERTNQSPGISLRLNLPYNNIAYCTLVLLHSYFSHIWLIGSFLSSISVWTDKSLICASFQAQFSAVTLSTFVGGAVASKRAVLVRALAGESVLCSWARQFTLTMPLSTQVYKWVPAICWGNLTKLWGSDL